MRPFFMAGPRMNAWIMSYIMRLKMAASDEIRPKKNLSRPIVETLQFSYGNESLTALQLQKINETLIFF